MRSNRPIAVLALAAASVLGACETKVTSPPIKESQQTPEKNITGTYKVGKPYQVNGVWYYPAEDYNYDETGIGSWYGPDFHGKKTANGEKFDQNSLTAAHRTLPMPSIVRVTNLENGRSILVRVNDRGPFAHGRIIDLSRRSAQLLGFEGRGTAKVRVQIMAEESRALAVSAGTSEEEAMAPPPAAAPRIQVAAETLPPPGSTEAPKPIPVAAVITRPERVPDVQAGIEQQKVEVVPVSGHTQMYIQAGAFQSYDNAHRVTARLSPIGPTAVTSVVSKGKELFRVRMGPLASLDEADNLLEQVVRAGYPDAKLIVD